MARCTILIPTWSAARTIETTVTSALRQTVEDIEVLIVGDGVTPDAREPIERCVAMDSRVRFLDLPKGENRGERNRHVGVLEASSPAVAYLGDDDLLLPQHVENMLGLLETVDFCQALNGFVNARDQLVLWPTDLGDPRWLRWHLEEPPRNRVSITGTAHTVDAYRRLERGWDVAPPGMWTDLWLWRQFFALPGLTAATHAEMTAIQVPSAAQRTMSDEEIAAQRQRWVDFVSTPEAHVRLQELVEEARRRQWIETDAAVTDLRLKLGNAKSDQDAELEEMGRALFEARKEAHQARERIASLNREHDALRATLSWRVTAPLRAVRRATRR